MCIRTSGLLWRNMTMQQRLDSDHLNCVCDVLDLCTQNTAAEDFHPADE